MDTDPLAHLLEKERSRLVAIERDIAELKHRRDVVLAKIEAFEMAKEATSELRPSRTKLKRNRPPTKDWQRLARIASERFPEHFGYDELDRVATEIGLDIQRASLRTKMMNYVNEGYAERVSDGQFRLTNKGRDYFKIEKRPGNSGPASFAQRQIAMDDVVARDIEMRTKAAAAVAREIYLKEQKRKSRF